MEKPRLDDSSDLFRDCGSFTTAAVYADDDVRGLEEDLEKEHKTLKLQVIELGQLEEERQRKLGVFTQKDGNADRVVRSFELRILDLVHKNRADLRYRRYIPAAGLRAITEAEPRQTEPKMIRGILETMEEDASAADLGPIVAEYQPRLEAAVSAVETAAKDVGSVESQIKTLKEKTIPATKARFVDEYVKLHGALRGKFPRDTARVESYFRQITKRRAKTASPAVHTQPATA
jgi:hypothetical protein